MSTSSLVNEELQPSPTPAPPRPVNGLAAVALVLSVAVTAIMVKAAMMLRDYNDGAALATAIGVVRDADGRDHAPRAGLVERHDA